MKPDGDGKPVKQPTKPDRAAREAAALRANLLKRKDQMRRRQQAGVVKDTAEKP